MRRWFAAALLLPLIACGSSPSAPSQVVPVPQPAPAPSPAPTPAPIVQPDPARFDATFNAQLVHDGFDSPGDLQPFRQFPSNPTIIVQGGLSAAVLGAMEAEARAVVPAFTANQLSVASFTSADGVPSDAAGRIVVEIQNDAADGTCGHAKVGAQSGHVWLNMAHPDSCLRSGPTAVIFGHELGHALGFFHVSDSTCLMANNAALPANGQPCDKERYHAGLAYQSNGAYAAPLRVPMVVD